VNASLNQLINQRLGLDSQDLEAIQLELCDPIGEQDDNEEETKKAFP